MYYFSHINIKWYQWFLNDLSEHPDVASLHPNPRIYLKVSVNNYTLNSNNQRLLTLMTTHEHPTIFLALPVLSILHKPAHSPNFLLSSTVIKGI